MSIVEISRTALIRSEAAQLNTAHHPTVGIGAIGLGGWGRTLAKSYTRSTHVDLKSCYSPSAERRAQFAADFSCAPATSLEALISRPDIDAVVIAVPNDQHAMAIEAAVAGQKHMFVEKPLAIEPEDIRRIQRALRGSGLILACGHTARRLAGIREMKRRIKTGELGAPTSVEAVFGNERGSSLSAGNWRSNPTQCPGGPLTQIGIHHVDNLQFLLGPVLRVSAFGKSPRPEIKNQLVVGVVLEFADTIGYISADWLTPGTFSLDVHCTAGRLRYELDYRWWGESDKSDAHSTLIQYPVPDTSVSPRGKELHAGRIPLREGDHLLEEVDEFALAILGQATVEVGLKTALLNVAVLLAAARSLATSQTVDVGDLTADLVDSD